MKQNDLISELIVPDWLPKGIKDRTNKANQSIQSRQIQLPFWDEDVRRIPNELVRSALFNARNRNKPRIYMKDVDIVVIGDGKVTFSGEELRQDDELVWLELIHLSRGQDAGRPVDFVPHSFCKAIEWSVSERSYERLRQSIVRMQATSLSVYSKRLKEGVSLSMIPFFEWRDKQGSKLPRYRVSVAPQLVDLFGGVYFTQLEWKQRLSLSPGIATWLHGYFASHKTPFPIKVETVYAGAGITTKGMRFAKRQILNALRELEAVGFLKENTSHIDDGGLIHVSRTNRR